jgi:hypothetical protein
MVLCRFDIAVTIEYTAGRMGSNIYQVLSITAVLVVGRRRLRYWAYGRAL